MPEGDLHSPPFRVLSSPGAARNLCRLARAAALEGRAGMAAQLLSSAETLSKEMGLSWSYWLVELNEGTLALVRTQLDEAAYTKEWKQGQGLALDQAIAFALDS